MDITSYSDTNLETEVDIDEPDCSSIFIYPESKAEATTNCIRVFMTAAQMRALAEQILGALDTEYGKRLAEAANGKEQANA